MNAVRSQSIGRWGKRIFEEENIVYTKLSTIARRSANWIVTFYFKKQVTEQVTEQVMALIHILSDKEMSIKEILKALNLKHRPTLLYDYIQPAMKLDIIEQTQPDSPKSPTQKYRLTDKGKKMI